LLLSWYLDIELYMPHTQYLLINYVYGEYRELTAISIYNAIVIKSYHLLVLKMLLIVLTRRLHTHTCTHTHTHTHTYTHTHTHTPYPQVV